MTSGSTLVDTGVFSSWDTHKLSYAVAQRKHKGEDRFLVHMLPVDGLCDAVLAVFDGHNGFQAAQYCRDNLVRELEAAFAALPIEQQALRDNIWPKGLNRLLRDMFGTLDTKIKAEHHAGTTMTIILIREVKDQSMIHMKLAWVGDSKAAIIDDSEATALTRDHRACCPTEQQRIANFYSKSYIKHDPHQTRPVLQVAENLFCRPIKMEAHNFSWHAGDGMLAPKTAMLTAVHSASNMTDMMEALWEESVEGREGRVSRPGSQGLTHEDDEDENAGIGLEPRRISIEIANDKKHAKLDDLKADIPVERGLSFIGTFCGADGEGFGPARVFNRNGASMNLSRSVGDKDAARAIRSDPDIRDKACSGCFRIVMCSDGVWDVFDVKRAAKLVKNKPDPKKASTKLVRTSTEARQLKYLQMDDITAVVVDFSPAGSSIKQIEGVSEAPKSGSAGEAKPRSGCQCCIC